MTTDPSTAFPVADLRNLETDDEWQTMTRLFSTSGVDSADGGAALTATLGTSPRQVSLALGGCFVEGRYRPRQAAADAVAIPAAAGSDRIDRVVMRLDRQAAEPEDVLKPVVITGSPAASPTAPAMLSNAQYTDIPLWQWRARSTGVLDQLRDERRFVGLTHVSAPTDIGVLSTHQPGSLWWQRTANRLTVKQDSGVYIVAAEDTGWVAPAEQSGLYQSVASSPPLVRAKNGYGALAGAVRRITSAVGRGDDNSPILRIQADLRPSRQWTKAGIYDNVSGSTDPGHCRLVVDTNGWLFVQEPSRNIDVNTFIYLSQASGWPIGG